MILILIENKFNLRPLNVYYACEEINIPFIYKSTSFHGDDSLMGRKYLSIFCFLSLTSLYIKQLRIQKQLLCEQKHEIPGLSCNIDTRYSCYCCY